MPCHCHFIHEPIIFLAFVSLYVLIYVPGKLFKLIISGHYRNEIDRIESHSWVYSSFNFIRGSMPDTYLSFLSRGLSHLMLPDMTQFQACTLGTRLR